MSADTEQRDASSRGWLLSLISASSIDSLGLAGPSMSIRRGIGGDDPNGIFLDDAAVSDGNVSLEQTADGYVLLTDSESLNPVRVNGAIARSVKLQAQDVLRVGNSLLVLERTDPSRRRSTPVSAMLQSVGFHRSTAAWVLESEVRFFDPESLVVALTGSGFRELDAFQTWLSREWDLECKLQRVQFDPRTPVGWDSLSGVPVTLENLDSPSPAVQSEILTILERRIKHGVPTLLVFREQEHQFYHRVCSIFADAVFNLPGYPQRRTDIIPTITSKFERLAGCAMDSLAPDILERLLLYSWPGGLGELERVARRFRRAMDTDGQIGELAIPPEIRSVHLEGQGTINTGLTRASFAAAFSEYNGNMKEIASHFGYARTSFYRLLRRENIDVQAIRAAGESDRKVSSVK